MKNGISKISSCLENGNQKIRADVRGVLCYRSDAWRNSTWEACAILWKGSVTSLTASSSCYFSSVSCPCKRTSDDLIESCLDVCFHLLGVRR